MVWTSSGAILKRLQREMREEIEKKNRRVEGFGGGGDRWLRGV